MGKRGNARHTPGPWRWDADGWIRSDCRGRTDIAEVNFSEEMVSDAPLEEACANATLIAAAPTLLEAAEILVVQLEAHAPDTAEGDRRALARAIAQARGEG